MAAPTAPPEHRTAGPAAHPLGPAAWADAPAHGDEADGKDPRHPLPGQGGMVPAPELVPDVLPWGDLAANGRPTGDLRVRLRRHHDVRNALNVAGAWVQSLGVVALACWITPDLPLPAALAVWSVAFVLLGRSFALRLILGHEAAHRLLFSNKAVNDWVGGWLVAYPGFMPLAAYRRGHMAHHKDEFGPGEPDLVLYGQYPITRASLGRKLRRDARGNTGRKQLSGLVRGLRSKEARPIALPIVITQVGVALAMVAIGGLSRWWLYPLLWLAPYATVWQLLNRLRGIAEHGGLMRSDDRRLTTHVVHQSWPARFWIVPFNTGYHLAHHVDPGVPFQELPALHDQLVASGWVTEDLEYPTYRSLWRALASRDDRLSA